MKENKTNSRNWQGIVVHHTQSHDVGVEVIRQWHQARGWDDIGYHFVIRADGAIEEGRSLEKIGAHAKGRNHTHIGLALTGCFFGEPPNPKCHTSPTEAQLKSLKELLNTLLVRFAIPVSKIERHHSQCPGERLPLEKIVALSFNKQNAC